MKPIRIITLIISVLALCYYGYRMFGNPNGKSYDIDKNHHVFYKGDGVTKDDAIKTADLLKEAGLIQSTEGMDVQILSEKTGGDVKFSLVFDKSKITPEAEQAALGIGAELNTRAFKGRKLSVSFADDHMDEIKDLGYVTQTQ